MGRLIDRHPVVAESATALGLFLLSLYCFRVLLGGVPDYMPGDHRAHLLYALGTNTTPVPHPLYHYSVTSAMTLSGEKGFDGARRCAALVLAVALAFRGWLSYRELSATMQPFEAAVACLALMLAMSLPSWWKFPNILLGQIHPNVWHNPTAPFAAPFAVLIFLTAMSYWDEPGLGKALGIGIWSALCALAKPNYLLAFLPCFGPVLLALLVRQVRQHQLTPSGAFAHLLAALAPPVWVLAVQFFYAYGGDGGVAFVPLRVWRSYSDNVPASAVLGLVFPLVVAGCYPSAVVADRRVVFAWCVMGAAVAQYAFLAEQPEARMLSGNFGWGMMPASYLLFLECCRLLGRQPVGNRLAACATILALHAASGTMHLVRSLVIPGDGQRF